MMFVISCKLQEITATLFTIFFVIDIYFLNRAKSFQIVPSNRRHDFRSQLISRCPSRTNFNYLPGFLHF